jgi:hypothetical protein
MGLGKQTMLVHSPGWLATTLRSWPRESTVAVKTGQDEFKTVTGPAQTRRATARDHVAARLPVENPPASTPSYFH